MPGKEGTGLSCNNTLSLICDAVGIKDLQVNFKPLNPKPLKVNFKTLNPKTLNPKPSKVNFKTLNPTP
jgi:hypothetical protein